MSWRERNKTTSERQSHLPIIGPYTGIHATHGTTVRDFWIRTHLAAAWVVQRHQFRRLVKGHLDTQWFVKFKKHCFLGRCVFDLNINEFFVQATLPSMANQIFRQGHFGGKRARLGGGAALPPCHSLANKPTWWPCIKEFPKDFEGALLFFTSARPCAGCLKVRKGRSSTEAVLQEF